MKKKQPTPATKPPFEILGPIFADVFAKRPPFEQLHDAIRRSDTPADFADGTTPASFIPRAIKDVTIELRSHVTNCAHQATYSLRKLKKSHSVAARREAIANVGAYHAALEAWGKSEEVIKWFEYPITRNSRGNFVFEF